MTLQRRSLFRNKNTAFVVSDEEFCLARGSMHKHRLQLHILE